MFLFVTEIITASTNGEVLPLSNQKYLKVDKALQLWISQ